MSLTLRQFLLLILAALAGTTALPARSISATTNDEFRRAAHAAKPGDSIVLSGGPFAGIHLTGIRGTKTQPITISGSSFKDPALFRGGKTGLHLNSVEFVTLRHLEFSGATLNGINIDDGGNKARPARGVVIENCKISNTGPSGNHDALKLSGLDQFTVRRCRFVGWGGSGIDMVGCHDGVIEDCTFVGKDGFSQSNGVQAKGGSARITIRECKFQNAGHRSINIGGSTGLDYFRPAVGDFEAKDIGVVGNRFSGSMAPIAWVGCSGGHVHHNTIYLPEKWIGRILQENTAEGFRPAHGGVFENNLIVFDRRVRSFINIGGGTAPESFTFRNNAWFDLEGSRRKPNLPVEETGGVYNVDPKLTDIESTLKISSPSPELADKGAGAYRRAEPPR